MNLVFSVEPLNSFVCSDLMHLFIPSSRGQHWDHSCFLLRRYKWIVGVLQAPSWWLILWKQHHCGHSSLSSAGERIHCWTKHQSRWNYHQNRYSRPSYVLQLWIHPEYSLLGCLYLPTHAPCRYSLLKVHDFTSLAQWSHPVLKRHNQRQANPRHATKNVHSHSHQQLWLDFHPIRPRSSRQSEHQVTRSPRLLLRWRLHL